MGGGVLGDRTEYLTVQEVMKHLRLGRTTVYAQARRYLETGGAEGIPCRRFGRSLRFPLAELESVVTETAATAAVERSRRPGGRTSHQPRQRTAPTPRRVDTTQPAQSELPFTA